MIDNHYAIKAHSDGDLIFHALTSCLLSSMNMNTLGYYFSDQDEKNKNRNSYDFLNFALNKFNNLNKVINNIDITIVCQKIMLSDYLDLIRENLIKILKTNNVSIKAIRFEKKNKRFIECYCLLTIN